MAQGVFGWASDRRRRTSFLSTGRFTNWRIWDFRSDQRFMVETIGAIEKGKQEYQAALRDEPNLEPKVKIRCNGTSLVWS